AGDRGAGRDRADDRGEREDPAERRRALDEWAAADALRAPVRERAADLLFQGLEEPGCERVHDDPETEDRAVVDRRRPGHELAVRERQERVTRQPGNRDPRTARAGT